MVFTVAVVVGLLKQQTLGTQLPCPHVQFIWASDPWFLVLVSASQLNFLMS